MYIIVLEHNAKRYTLTVNGFERDDVLVEAEIIQFHNAHSAFERIDGIDIWLRDDCRVEFC